MFPIGSVVNYCELAHFCEISLKLNNFQSCSNCLHTSSNNSGTVVLLKAVYNNFEKRILYF